MTGLAALVAAVGPDVLALAGVDYDRGGAALAALAAVLEQAGTPYPHRFALPPNAGLATGRDMDGDGRAGTPRDAQGYGRFAGAGGLALLSRLPIRAAAARDFTALLWRDLPGADPPRRGDAPFPDARSFALQRLSSTGHWDVPVATPRGPLHLLLFAATPPVFDGPEDRNGRRNRDEAALWLRYLDGQLGPAPPEGPLAVIGNANLDPLDGEGRRDALAALLSHPRLQDPAPRSAGGAEAARLQDGANDGQRGDPARDTADWGDGPGGPGNLRVDYILPSRDLEVTGAGVFWPTRGDPLRPLLAAGGSGVSRHRLVWVDVAPR